MIVDSSAVLAILLQEPEAAACSKAMDEARTLRISAATLLETMIVVDGRADAIAGRSLDLLIEEARIIVEPVTEEHARIGREAYRDFGKGSRHPAQLNYGDCFAYALAMTTGEPLLFKGNDFSHTDVRAAL